MPQGVRFVDLETQQARIKDQLNAAMARVLAHGQYIMGPEIAELEARLAAFCGVRHAITCASGTDVLALSLMALGVRAGDAILVPAFTFAATAEAVALLGAVPVFADVSPDTFNLEPNLLERGTNAARRAGLQCVGIIAVDLFGQPADYDAIHEFAQPNGLWVVADAAQSFGASWRGRRVGTLAQVTATSFYPAKPLGCYGDGGPIFTDDPELAVIMRSLRVHGQGGDKYDNVRIGVNARRDTLQAAVLLAKLEIFADEIEARQCAAERYNEVLQGAVVTPFVCDAASSTWAQYTIRCFQRDALCGRLASTGIPTVIYYPRPLHWQTAYHDFPIADGGCPIAERLAAEVLSLPMHAYLDPAMQERIAGAVSGACSHRRTSWAMDLGDAEGLTLVRWIRNRRHAQSIASRCRRQSAPIGRRVQSLAMQSGSPRSTLIISKQRSAPSSLRAARLSNSVRAGAPSSVGAKNSGATAGNFLRNASILGIGNIASQVGLLICAPLLTRLYTPEALGTLAIFLTVATTLSTIGTGKYEFAIVLPRCNVAAFNVVIICFLSLVTNLLLFIVFISVIDLPHVASGLGIEFSPMLLWWIAPLLAALSIAEVCRYWTLRKEQFSLLCCFLIIQAWAVAAIQVTAGIVSQGGAMQLVVASVIAYLTVAGLFAAVVLLYVRPGLWYCITVRRMLALAKRYRNFPFYSAPYALLAMAAGRALFILLGAYVSPAAVGFLALATRITSLPNSVISPALNSAFFRWAASHIGEPRVLEGLIRNVLHVKIVAGVPVIVLFALHAEWLFALVFGHAWGEAGLYAAYLVVSAFFLFLTNWLSHAYSVLHKQRRALIFEFAYDLVMLTAVLVCLASGLGAVWAVAAFSVVTALYNMVWLGFTLVMLGMRIRLLIESGGLIALMTALSLAIHFGAVHVFNSVGYLLVAIAFVGTVSIYAVARAWSLLRGAEGLQVEQAK